MTSSSGLGSTNVTLQFELSRDVDAAARDVQAAINAARGQLPANLPSNPNYWEVNPDDQLFQAVNYMPLIVAARNGAIVRLADLGEVSDSVENVRVGGLANGKPGVLVFVMTEPNANVIETVDRVRAELPRFKALLPAGVDMKVAV